MKSLVEGSGRSLGIVNRRAPLCHVFNDNSTHSADLADLVCWVQSISERASLDSLVVHRPSVVADASRSLLYASSILRT